MIIIGLGTRAEAIKMLPVVEELKRRKLDFQIIATGQHNISEIIKPDLYLTYPPSESSRFGLSKIKAAMWSLLTLKKAYFFLRNGHYKVLVHGDTLSTLLISLAANYSCNELIHIEAGLRSGCNFEPNPEERIRQIVDKLSDVLFIPTKNEFENVKHFEKKLIVCVGNTSIDNLKKYKIKTKRGNYVVASIHRQENLNNEKRLRMIFTALNNINLKVYLYAHDPLMIAVSKYNIKLNKNIITLKMINHEKFIKKVAGSLFVCADGGSIQEECAYLHKPCILFREYTERHGFDFGKGNTSKLIVNRLK